MSEDKTPFTAKKVSKGPIVEKVKVVPIKVEEKAIDVPKDGVFILGDCVLNAKFGGGYIKRIKPGGIAVCDFGGSLRPIPVKDLKHKNV